MFRQGPDPPTAVRSRSDPARLPNLGIGAVVAYSEAGPREPGRQLADEAISSAGPMPRHSYLFAPAIVSAAGRNRLRRPSIPDRLPFLRTPDSPMSSALTA